MNLTVGRLPAFAMVLLFVASCGGGSGPGAEDREPGVDGGDGDSTVAGTDDGIAGMDPSGGDGYRSDHPDFALPTRVSSVLEGGSIRQFEPSNGRA